ncbi:DUF3108 domain-containing protein [Geomonas terrae]|uniref:DUF3108 domain-containing protein n=1 Tax=Geomonas terrae TaxID=2562681 RepID=A0A4S1CLY8_9BACT|nr:DUF3108 domain-containing protein [Geomonas terrae]TGU74818.1 DUF3108 domain-containing protein [Geomonas terrae]
MKNFLLGIVLLLTAPIHPAHAFPPPERLVYDATWNGISAGSAVIELTRQEDGFKAVNTIRSAGLVSTIFRIEDHIESVMSADGRPHIYRASINEGRHHTRNEVVFDFKGLQAETTDLVRNTRKKEAITAETHDDLSSLYFLRSRPLAPGTSILFDIYDGKRLWNAEARVTKRQQLTTRQGTVTTVVVVSTLKANGVLSKVGGTTFWFSDDTRHIPLKMKTKLKVGEMVLTLK